MLLNATENLQKNRLNLRCHSEIGYLKSLPSKCQRHSSPLECGYSIRLARSIPDPRTVGFLSPRPKWRGLHTFRRKVDFSIPLRSSRNDRGYSCRLARGYFCPSNRRSPITSSIEFLSPRPKWRGLHAFRRKADFSIPLRSSRNDRGGLSPRLWVFHSPRP